MNTESVQAASILMGLCSRLFYGSLSEEDFTALKEQSDLFREEPFISVAPQAAAALADILSAARTPDEIDALYHELKQDYTYLFYQTTLSRLSPYESVWRTDDQTLFGPTTLEVRNAYKEAGFELAADTSQPDDHIGAELDFLGRLLERAAQNSGSEQATRDIERARAFASDHLLVFSPYYLEDFIEAAHTPFYEAAGQLAQESIAAVALLLGASASADIYRMP